MSKEKYTSHYKTLWVPKFGYEYSKAKIQASDYEKWDTEEFTVIAKKNALEDLLARECNKILIYDTDSFATSLWHERYMNFISSEVENLSLDRQLQYVFSDRS